MLFDTRLTFRWSLERGIFSDVTYRKRGDCLRGRSPLFNPAPTRLKLASIMTWNRVDR